MAKTIDELFEELGDVEWDKSSMPDSQERLFKHLLERDCPVEMLSQCLQGEYHDYASNHSLPKHKLVQDAEAAGLSDIASNAKRGVYDP